MSGWTNTGRGAGVEDVGAAPRPFFKLLKKTAHDGRPIIYYIYINV